MVRSVVLYLVHLAPNQISSLLIWYSSHSSISPFYIWMDSFGGVLLSKSAFRVGVSIPPSSTPVPPLSCLLWHGPLLIPTRTLRTMTSCLCVRGGFSESSQPLLRSAASLCAPPLILPLLLLWMLLGCILEEGVQGSRDPTSIAATEPDMNDKWRRRLRRGGGGGLGTGMCSSLLRCAQAPYSDISAPFWTYLPFHLWHKSSENWQGELDLHVFLFPPPLFLHFFCEGLWVEFLLSSPKETNFLAWHWLWSLWASGAPVKWLTGWKVGLNP